MKEENKNRLTSIFENEKKVEIQRNIEIENTKNRQDEFINSFEKLCNEVIQPKMLEFKELLNTNGYGCFINYNKENSTEKGFDTKPNINFEISHNVTDKFYSRNKYPHIMFIADKSDLKIMIHENTMFPNSSGHAGMKNKSYTIEELNSDIVEKEVTESIEKILKK